MRRRSLVRPAQRRAGRGARDGPGRGAVALAFLAALTGLACGAEREAPPGPPAAPHGAVVIEPNELRVGDLLWIDVTVVTPPDHRVRPIDLADPGEALWLLDAEPLPVRRDGERWTHVTRARARVKQAPGEYAWPAQTVEVESPDGELVRLELEAREFRVGSVAASLPDRLEPFGLRAPAPAGSGPGGLMAALLGSAATLLALAGWSLARRRLAARRGRGRSTVPAPDAAPVWVWADAELEAALAGLEADPDVAADRAARALRRYVQRRTRRPVESLTTEEIAAQRPPGRLRSGWPRLVALLRRLDALRFPGGLAREEGRAALRDLLEDARRFVSDSIPPRELR